MLARFLFGLALAMSATSSAAQAPYVVVLGVAQDGGAPQLGYSDHPGWDDAAFRRLATSLALVDPETGQRWLFEATPDIREQLKRLDLVAPVEKNAPGLDGIFLTHAHMGHYTGLLHLGHEALGARSVPLFVMPEMQGFLTSNEPWHQLVRYENVTLHELEDGEAVQLNERLAVTPFLVPHRQEHSEVVGYRIEGPDRSIVFIPDIDSWEEWDDLGTHIEDVIASSDVAYLDATFYANGEIPGRDMSTFPHPFITHSMERFAPLPAPEKAKVRFIHLNHTNPALRPGTPARDTVRMRGFELAEALERVTL
ncbi:MAG: pyrroloquinoline quinone biosynthesis protein PqqB [Rubricoccaceae bacterium]